MGCMFQDIDVTSCFDLQSSNRILIFFKSVTIVIPEDSARKMCLVIHWLSSWSSQTLWESLAGWHEGCFARAWL